MSRLFAILILAVCLIISILSIRKANEQHRCLDRELELHQPIIDCLE